MKRKCPHCNEEIEFEKHQQFGGHLTNCKMNPKRKEIVEKIKETRHDNLFNTYKIKCLNCGKIYQLEITENSYRKGKYRKCCCKDCAHKYSASFTDHSKLKNVSCTKCGKTIEVKLNAQKKYLCVDCGGSYIGQWKTKEGLRLSKIKRGNIPSKSFIDGKILCNCCGQEETKKHDICNAYIHGTNKIFDKLGFDKNKIGSLEFYNEYNRIIKLLEKEYENNSLVEIGEKYDINYQTIYTLFKRFGIKARNTSDSVKLAFKKGRYGLSNVNIYPYKSGYHTTWEGKQFWYRSSYELEFAKKLDEGKISYDMETLRIQYWDSVENCERTAIPDFYLNGENKIIEIKSSYTLIEQEMKDKFKAYKKLGYKCELILDKKLVEI